MDKLSVELMVDIGCRTKHFYQPKSRLSKICSSSAIRIFFSMSVDLFCAVIRRDGEKF